MKINTIKTALFLFAMIFLPNDIMSQKLFTLEELNFGGLKYQSLRPEMRYTTWWGDKLIEKEIEKCKIINTNNGSGKTIFTLNDINKWAKLSSCNDKVRHLYNVEFPYSERPIVLISNGKTCFLINFETHQLEKKWNKVKGTQANSWNKISGATAYVKDNQLHVIDKTGKDVQITNDGSQDIVYGQSVHRDEFGIKGGLYWSNNGEKLAFYRMDQSMVTSFPLIHIQDVDWKPSNGKSRIATPEPIKYPMAGETSHKVTVGIYNLQTKKTIYLKAGDPTDRYFTNISWGIDDKKLYMFELNRDQNDCELVAYNTDSGEKVATIYKETDDKYVEPSHAITFLPWDKHRFIMQSQKDGYNHIYLYNLNNNKIKQITKGKWVVIDVLGFNNKDKSIIYVSNECSPIQRNTWSVNIASGKRTLLDNSKGYHYPSLSKNGKFIVDNYSEPNVPRKIDIITFGKNTKRINWLTANNPWKDYVVPQYSCGKIKAADGVTDLYWRMVKPNSFDPKKKYPTVVYVYGGPHAHNVDASWHYGSRSWETYMAQKGYILFILDNRGSENRGKDFEQATFRQLGQIEMKDQKEGVKYLKSLSYIDQDKIGVHGWSFGGFMTISLMTNYPETFKVGVAGGPVIDWKWYEAMYGERYMDTPQTNSEGYAKTSLLSKAKNLRGRLQIITGLNDPVVLPQHCFTFLKACIECGTQPDFFVYPGEPHNMRGHQSVHLHERITRYFEDYLKGNNKQ